MKATVRRLIFIHLAVLALAAAGSALVWSWSGSLSSVAGAFAFSLPAMIFSLIITGAMGQDSSRFLGRVVLAEVLKWALAGGLLAAAFASTLFVSIPLLAGFLLSVVSQVVTPILVKRGSEA